jgi:hypothetical protein
VFQTFPGFIRRRKMTKLKLTLSTNADGTGSVTSRVVDGCLYGIYVEVGTLAATSDLTITQNDGQGSLPVLTVANVSASGWYVPVISATHYTGSGTPKTDGMVPVTGEITIAVAEGGASKSGSIYLLVEE